MALFSIFNAVQHWIWTYFLVVGFKHLLLAILLGMIHKNDFTVLLFNWFKTASVDSRLVPRVSGPADTIPWLLDALAVQSLTETRAIDK